MKLATVLFTLVVHCHAKQANQKQETPDKVDPAGAPVDLTTAQGVQNPFVAPQANPVPAFDPAQGNKGANPVNEAANNFLPYGPLAASSGPVFAQPGIVLPEHIPSTVHDLEVPTFDPPTDAPVDYQQPPILKYTQQPPNDKGLVPGDVFGLVTKSTDRNVNNEPVIIYQDGTLGIKEPSGTGYLFEATLLPEYNILLVPEPLATVKLNDNGVFFVNDSLYNPLNVFLSKGWTLLTDNSYNVICPSWNSVLVNVDNNSSPPCSDAVSASLSIVPIMV